MRNVKIITLEVAGFDSALRGMRNPMNSWNKMILSHSMENQILEKKI